MHKTTATKALPRAGYHFSRQDINCLSAGRVLLCALLVLSMCQRGLSQDKGSKPGEISSLFREEILQASQKMHWRGERLNEDTLYSLALTGMSWEIAWGREHPFSLAWGDYSRAPRLNGQAGKNDQEFIAEVKRTFDRRDYRRAVDTASSHFTLEQIGCETTLKEAVGKSLLALGQPEQAFPVFAAPFDPGLTFGSTAALNRRFREQALEAAARAGLKREMAVISISLLLEPGEDGAGVDASRVNSLEKMGVDIDRLILGILECPERLRGLPAYTYVAADLLAWRASPRLFPVLLRLSQSPDPYLRSRAVLGLGITAYQHRAADPTNWLQKVLTFPLLDRGVSSSQRKLLDKELKDALTNDHYRVRVAGIIALSLIGDEQESAAMERLMKDRTYVLLAPNGENDKIRHLFFPIRSAASAGLSRFGTEVAPGGGRLSGRELEKEKRGGKDATHDSRGLRKEVVSQLQLSPLDVPVPLAPEPTPSAHRER